eukprot:1180362-Prorocentrum_minimum.AAC.3
MAPVTLPGFVEAGAGGLCRGGECFPAFLAHARAHVNHTYTHTHTCRTCRLRPKSRTRFIRYFSRTPFPFWICITRPARRFSCLYILVRSRCAALRDRLLCSLLVVFRSLLVVFVLAPPLLWFCTLFRTCPTPSSPTLLSFESDSVLLEDVSEAVRSMGRHTNTYPRQCTIHRWESGCQSARICVQTLKTGWLCVASGDKALGSKHEEVFEVASCI